MPNPLYTDMYQIYDLQIHFFDNIFKQAWADFFAHSQVVSSISFNTKNSIYYRSFVYTELNGFKQILLSKSNYSIQHYSFVCTQLNGSQYCYVSQTIQFETS